MCLAGDPEVMEAVRECKRTLKQIHLEEVRQDPQTLESLLRRHDVACRRMARAAMQGASHALTDHECFPTMHSQHQV